MRWSDLDWDRVLGLAFVVAGVALVGGTLGYLASMVEKWVLQ